MRTGRRDRNDAPDRERVTDSTIANYRKFIESRMKSGLTVQRFKPGSASQIRLRRDPDRYSDFEIRNIIANGEVWTGSGVETRPLFPPP